MTPEELKAFLEKHGMDSIEFAELLGLNRMAIDYWLTGKRSIARPYGRLIRLFDKHPHLMREFWKEQGA